MEKLIGRMTMPNGPCHQRHHRIKRNHQSRQYEYCICVNTFTSHGVGWSLLMIALLLIIPEPAMACSSRAITKPRPTTLPSSDDMTTTRPNITFPIFNCPPTYAAWYCLNDATCFTVEIHNEILYNCECAIGFMGPRCEYKEIDGSYLPTRQRVMLEKASIASGATLALLLMFIVCLTLYIRHEKKLKKLNESTAIGHENAGMDEVDTGPGMRPFGPHHYKILPLDYAFRR